MPRQVQAIEVNKFNAGLVTDASPLTSVENSSLEEDNFVLNIDGSRNRRLGMDYESSYSIISTVVTGGSVSPLAITSFKWDNAGGDPEKNILVVQVGDELKFYNLDVSNAISDNLYTSSVISDVSLSQPFSYCVVDGILIVTSGRKNPIAYQFTAPSTITFSEITLQVRDLFGVEDVSSGIDLMNGSGIQKRPVSLSQAHLYNLRNQTWGVPRVRGDDDVSDDPISVFKAWETDYFPSNSDTVIEALYPNPENAANRTVERFFAPDLVRNPLGTTLAPQGYFIIDALERGASRLSNDATNRLNYGELSGTPVTALPLDKTPGGPTCVSEYAGRVWYAGFSGVVEGGDSKSPRMSSYILFSQVVDSLPDISACYQAGDPTSKNAPDIVDTDGGFIRINEAYGICKLVAIADSLFVIAANGVWRIVGGSDTGFTATRYIVEKLSQNGTNIPNSVVVIDGKSIMFWSEDAIYHVTPDQFGSWGVSNISFGKVQNFYNEIVDSSRMNAKGLFDSYERKVRWIFNSATNDTNNTKELVFDTQLGAFYVNTLGKLSSYPKVIGMYIGKPYQVLEQDIIPQRELKYIIATSTSGVLQYTFGAYTNEEFRDWFSEDGVGVDAEAYMVTNYLSGGDFQRRKGATYMTIHMRRTETGFDEDMNPLTPSSCLVQSRWGWSNSDNSGKWGREFQAYRYRTFYIPVDETDNYNNGFLIVSSRNKLRGDGKVLSLRFKSEPYKNLHLYGWSMVFTVSGDV